MKNIDRIRRMGSLEEIGNFICRIMDSAEYNENKCDDMHCPVYHLCKNGRNGFTAWLDAEETKYY